MPKAKIKFVLFAFLLVSSGFSFPTSPALAYYNNMEASVVVGQTNFTDTASGTAADKLNTDTSLLFVDPKGRLLVADNGNNRVLIWNSIPARNGQAADLVLGQPDFATATSNTGGISASTMFEPWGIYSDGNRLIVADRRNNRTLIWNNFPTQNGQAADVVVGQPDMDDSTAVCSATGADQPNAVWIYNNNLIVTQRNGRRVLIYNPIPTTNGASASLVLGQTDFVTCTTPPGSASSFDRIEAVNVDSTG